MNLPRTLARVAATGAAFAFSTVGALAAVPTNVMPSGPTGAVGVNSDIDFADIISFAATYLLSIAGGIAVLFLVIGGIFYITAGGSDEKVQKAKKYMQNAIVGLVVVLLAFVIVSNTLKITYSLEGGDEQVAGDLTQLTTDAAAKTAPATITVTCVGVTACPMLTTSVKGATGADTTIATLSVLSSTGNTATYAVADNGAGVAFVTFSYGTVSSTPVTVTVQ